MNEIETKYLSPLEKIKKMIISPLSRKISFILLPTFISIIYYSFVATDQYFTEAKFSIKSHKDGAEIGLLGTVLGSSMGMADSDSRSVVDFIRSHDAVRLLDQSVHLRDMFRRPEADIVSRLPEKATFEDLVDYYLSRITATYDVHSGVTTLQVKTYRPEDSLALSKAILVISENIVNSFNRRAEEDSVRVARAELAFEEKRLIDIQARLRKFQVSNNELDPKSRSGAVQTIVAELEGEVAKETAKLRALETFMQPTAQQVVTQRERVKALQGQVEVQKGRLTGNNASSIVNTLYNYESLKFELNLVEKAYSSAVFSLETARISAQQQQKYVITVVEPHLAQEALYPKRIENILTTLIFSIIIIGILKLIINGIRDHFMTGIKD